MTKPRAADAVEGEAIAGYRLEEQIGQGGMAVVYRARDERLDRRVALKVLAPGLAADAAFRQRFIRESRLAAAVDHPNIIPVYEAGDAGGVLFIAMRYVQGGDVRSLLSRNGPLSAARAFSIIAQVAAALDAAHARGLIHRDIKPANMLLDAAERATAGDGGVGTAEQQEHVYLSDFGISKLSLASQQLTSTGQFIGTLDYIAPEQIEGRALDGRADLYALGCAAYELLSGLPPYRKEEYLAIISAHLTEPPPSLAASRPDLPPVVDRVLAKAMSKSPDGRYARCAQFASDLGRALGLVPGAVEAVGLPTQGGDQPKPYPVTELAGPPAAPAARTGHEGAPGGPLAGSAPQVTPAAPAVTPVAQEPGFDPSTVQAARQGAPGGTAPVGGSGQPGPYGSGPYGPAPYGPAPYGPAPYGPAPYGSGPYGPAPYGPPPYGSGPYGPAPYGPPPYGSGPSGPAPYGQTAPRSRRSRTMIIAAVVAAVAVAAAAVAVVLVHAASNNSKGLSGLSGSSTPPASSPASSSAASPAALSQATAISNLLTSSARSRFPLQNAVNDAGQCINVASDVSQIQRVRNQRQTEYNRAQRLSASALQNGTALLSDLTRALFYSLRADNDYLIWARQQLASCQAGSQANATADNDQAANFKNMFVSLWNPVASQYSLPPAFAGSI